MVRWFHRKKEKVIVVDWQRYKPRRKREGQAVRPIFAQNSPPPSACFLKCGFCCPEGKEKAKVVATNHVARLMFCGQKKCENVLVKEAFL